jgi:hypothetical protein
MNRRRRALLTVVVVLVGSALWLPAAAYGLVTVSAPSRIVSL